VIFHPIVEFFHFGMFWSWCILAATFSHFETFRAYAKLCIVKHLVCVCEVTLWVKSAFSIRSRKEMLTGGIELRLQPQICRKILKRYICDNAVTKFFFGKTKNLKSLDLVFKNLNLFKIWQYLCYHHKVMTHWNLCNKKFQHFEENIVIKK
jgi:hypothetical protein